MKTPSFQISETVEIIVRSSGATNTARAGSGKAAKHASSTSDGLSAAYRAAAKFFGLPVDALCVIAHRDIDTCTRSYIGRPLERGEKLTTITFVDGGQDFLQWVLSADGVVIDCSPFQAWMWCGCKVTNQGELARGVKVRVRMASSEETSIRYPVEAVSTEPWKGGAA